MCSFVVKLTLSQILLEFTHFIFTTINTHISIQTYHLLQNTQILSKSTKVPWRDLSFPPKIVQTLFPRNEVKHNHETSTTKTSRVKT